MPGTRILSAADLFPRAIDDIHRLRNLGITDHAIVTYVNRVREGRPEDVAFRGLLHGRSLNRQQIQLVRAVLTRLPVARRHSAEAGWATLAPAISLMDHAVDTGRLFFAGLLFIVSPLVTWTLLKPLLILDLVLWGVFCSATALLVSTYESQPS